MKRAIVGIICFFVCINSVMASPLVDILIGGVMLGTGEYFEIQRGKYKSDADTALANSATNINNWQINLVNANYFKGAADWELIVNGNTSAYQTFYSRFTSYYAVSQVQLTNAINYSSQYGDANDKANLYKGVSLTSFAVGSAFVIKGVIGYLIERNQIHSAKAKSNYRWAKRFDIVPTVQMDGAQLRWEYKI